MRFAQLINEIRKWRLSFWANRFVNDMKIVLSNDDDQEYQGYRGWWMIIYANIG